MQNLWIIKMPIKDKPKSLDLMETIEEERRRTIEDIPNEILLKIFYYLSFNDNIAAGDVCKRWKKIAQDPYNHPHSFLKQISKVFTIKTLMPHIMPHRDKVHSCDQDKLFEFAQSSQQENWKTAVYTLNRTLELITEYAICTLGFKKVILEDKIVLLKEGAFEVAIIRMSRYFDQNQNTVQFGDTFIPLEDFTKLSNSPKTELVTQISDFVTNLADIQFSEKVLALYSAYIIYQDYQFGLVNPQDVRRLNVESWQDLEFELMKTLENDEFFSTMESLTSRIENAELKRINELYKAARLNFNLSFPIHNMQLSEIFKELFSLNP